METLTVIGLFIFDQVIYQLIGILFQALALIFDFQLFNKKEMLENKYNGSASFVTMFKRYFKGRRFESENTFYMVLLITLSIHIMSLVMDLNVILRFFNISETYDIGAIIIVSLGLFVFGGKIAFLRWMNKKRSQVYGRKKG